MTTIYIGNRHRSYCPRILSLLKAAGLEATCIVRKSSEITPNVINNSIEYIVLDYKTGILDSSYRLPDANIMIFDIYETLSKEDAVRVSQSLSSKNVKSFSPINKLYNRLERMIEERVI